jgi:hypothetical protein
MVRFPASLRRGGLIIALLFSFVFIDFVWEAAPAHAGGGVSAYCFQTNFTEVASVTDPNAPWIPPDVTYDRCLSKIFFRVHAWPAYSSFQLDYRTPAMISEAHTTLPVSYFGNDPQGRMIYLAEFDPEPYDATYTFHVRNCWIEYLLPSYMCDTSWSNTVSIHVDGFSVLGGDKLHVFG